MTFCMFKREITGKIKAWFRRLFDKKQGYIQVEGGKVWYKIVGEKKNTPLIVLHGGPGYPHDYLEPLEDLAAERQVIFYDQLGCGNSERPNDVRLWTVSRFVSELVTIIDTLKLKKYHLLGHSWGAALAYAFAKTSPKGLQSIVFADPYLSTSRWEEDARRLSKLLSEEDQAALARGNIGSEDFQKATREYYRRFVYGMNTFPEACIRSSQKMSREAYNYMWGPTELLVEGTLKDFDASSGLRDLKVPTLFICGRFDEATPESSEYFASLVPNSKVKILEKSAHHAHWTERGEYMQAVNTFLKEIDNAN